MALSKKEGLIGYITAPDYHSNEKPEWGACAELCSLAESFVQGRFPDKAGQGQPPVFRDTLQRQAKTGSPSEFTVFTELREPFGHGELLPY